MGGPSFPHTSQSRYLLHANRRLRPRPYYAGPSAQHIMHPLHHGHFYDSWAVGPCHVTVPELLGPHSVEAVPANSPDGLRSFAATKRLQNLAHSVETISSTAMASDAAETRRQPRNQPAKSSTSRPRHMSQLSRKPSKLARRPKEGNAPVIKEATTEVDYPSSDGASRSLLARQVGLCASFAEYAQRNLAGSRPWPGWGSPSIMRPISSNSIS